MDAEQLFGKTTGLVAGAKGNRNRQSVRKPAVKGAKFADTLASLSAAGKNRPAIASKAATGNAVAAIPQPATPAAPAAPATPGAATPSTALMSQPHPAASGLSEPRTREQQRRTRSAASTAPLADAEKAREPAAAAGTSRPVKSRHAARILATTPAAEAPAVVAGGIQAVSATSLNAAAKGETGSQPDTRPVEARKGHGTPSRRRVGSDESPRTAPAANPSDLPATAAAAAVVAAQGVHPTAPPAKETRVDAGASTAAGIARENRRTERRTDGAPATTAGTAPPSGDSASRPSTRPVFDRTDGGNPAFETRHVSARNEAKTNPDVAAAGAAPAATETPLAPRRATAPQPAIPAEHAKTAHVPASDKPFDAAQAVATAADAPAKSRPHAKTAAEPAPSDKGADRQPAVNLTAAAAPHVHAPKLPSFTTRHDETAAMPAAADHATAAAASEQLASADKAGHPVANSKSAATNSTAARETVSAAAHPAPDPGNASADRHDLPHSGADSPQPFIGTAGAAHRSESTFSVGNGPDAAAAGAPDFAPLHEQVRMRLSTLPDGAHEVALTLAPENLGKLQIDLKLSGGRMDAVVRAENPEAREALIRDLPALREALASSGIILSSFDVSLSGSGNPPEQQAARQATGWEMAQGNRSRQDSGEEKMAGGFRPGRTASQTGIDNGSPTHWIA